MAPTHSSRKGGKTIRTPRHPVDKPKYIRSLKAALGRHLEILQDAEKLHQTPKKYRNPPANWIRKSSDYRVWVATATQSKRIRLDLIRTFGEKAVQRGMRSRGGPTRLFQELVEKELEQLVRDFPETLENIPKWKKWIASRTSIMDPRRPLTELERAADLLYLVRCRRRTWIGDWTMVVENRPF
ncbi:MAG: hypothetical protein AABW68_04105 [archaeon]